MSGEKNVRATGQKRKNPIVAKVTISEETCKGCQLCISVCPKQVLELNRGKLNSKGYNPCQVVRPEDCIACGFCGMICPDSAITVERE